MHAAVRKRSGVHQLEMQRRRNMRYVMRKALADMRDKLVDTLCDMTNDGELTLSESNRMYDKIMIMPLVRQQKIDYRYKLIPLRKEWPHEHASS